MATTPADVFDLFYEGADVLRAAHKGVLCNCTYQAGVFTAYVRKPVAIGYPAAWEEARRRFGVRLLRMCISM
jgi:hypothetical protein